MLPTRVLLLPLASRGSVRGKAAPRSKERFMPRPCTRLTPAACVVADSDRDASVAPRTMGFSPSNWDTPQAASVIVDPYASTSAAPMLLRVASTSLQDPVFRGAPVRAEGAAGRAALARSLALHRPARVPPTQTNVPITDQKGDTLAYPKVLRTLPFEEVGSTSGAADDYHVTCGEGDEDSGGGRVRAPPPNTHPPSIECVYVHERVRECVLTPGQGGRARRACAHLAARS